MTNVSRQFVENFKLFEKDRLERGVFTEDEMAEYKDIIRKDLAYGTDRIRFGCAVFVGGILQSGEILDHKERTKLWSDYFEEESKLVLQRKAA